MNPNNPIVIVGIGGVFPGAHNLEDFWRLIVSGMSAADEVPAQRWSLDPQRAFKEGIHDDSVYSKHACLINDFALDYAGLHIDPEIIDKLDPMFHLLLHAGREAWLDSQYENIDSKRCGIIIGNIALPTEYSSRYTSEICGPLFSDAQNLDNTYTTTNNTDGLNRYVAGLPAGVLAQALGLHGGTHTLDAACASSLYALKYACDELHSGRADCMLAGGVSRPDSLYTQMGFSQLHALSASGSCAPFSSDGDGLVVGEGAGIFVLKRLDDALADNDHIYARIAGIGLSNDIEGNLFLPASEGQCRAMSDAYTAADWDASSVDHIECHGTGTPTGDAVEFQSLKNIWANVDTGTDTEKRSPCIIGSVKSNVGHLLTGAGAAGLMKTLLAFKHKTLPPTANFKQANESLDLENTPFDVLQESQDWQQPADHARRAAISAFGFGGINAHVLIEEYIAGSVGGPPTHKRRNSHQDQHNTEPTSPQATFVGEPPTIPDNEEEIALVGIAAQFGPWKDLAAVSDRMFNVHENTTATPSPYWLDSPLVKNATAYSIDSIDIPVGRFRIPPKELQDLLPQQLLMLLMSADAVDDVRGARQMTDDSALALRSGVYIGIGLDPQTCNFHLRWELEKKIRNVWGTELSSAEQDAWIQQLRDAYHTPLTANRTMGALGGIVASRIARALQCGGPSFTVSNEECSGMQALETAVRSLRNHDIDQAIIGAVDFASDIRSVLSQQQHRVYNQAIFSDGACAFVAKRLSDAQRDGDRIYACIRGLSRSSAADIAHAVPLQDAYSQTLHHAYNVQNLPTPQLIITHGSGCANEDQREQQALDHIFSNTPAIALSSAIGDLGHSGAASGLASVLKACLSLHHHSIPLTRKQSAVSDNYYKAQHSRYWLHNDADGPRIAAASSVSCDGNVMHAVLSEAPQSDESTNDIQSAIDSYPHGLFLFSADDNDALLKNIDACLQQQTHNKKINIHQHAMLWNAQHTSHGSARAACVAENPEHLLRCLQQLRSAIENGDELQLAQLAYTPEPLHTAKNNDIAFVFPGSGNHFTQMGSSISSYWPQVLDQQSIGSQFYKDQFARGKFWSQEDCTDFDHRDGIFGQVWYGAMLSEVISSFGVKAHAIIGYSLGETAGFFATRTWRDRDLMLQRIQDSTLFTHDLAGRCQAVRDTWNCADDEDVDWRMVVINTSVEKVSAVLPAYPRVYVLIINTPAECVIGGDAAQLQSLIDELQVSTHNIEGVTTVHCEVAKPVATAYRDLHLFPCTPPENTRFYSGIRAAAYEVNTDSAADSIIGQALDPFNYAQVIQQAYDDGIRIFIEMGPRGTCTRMIDVTLKDQKHFAISASIPNQDGSISCMRTCAQLFAQGIDLNADAFYSDTEIKSKITYKTLAMATGKSSYDVVDMPIAHTQKKTSEPVHVSRPSVPTPAPTNVPAHSPQTTSAISATPNALLSQAQKNMSVQHDCHQQFLRLQQSFSNSISQAVAWSQGQPLAQTANIIPAPVSAPTVVPAINKSDVLFDYQACMEIATGSIAAVLGEEFAVVDTYSTRVRLPDEPLMLAHRIMRIDAEKGSMSHGTVVTEHDVHPDAWYLDCNRIPTCIAVEAGQADLFLSGYLGIDFITKGNAVYRLLDAEVCFYQELPQPNTCINYEISISEFFKQGDTYLFRFQFDATIYNEKTGNRELLLTMRKGIAGFFTQAELDAGKGVVLTKFDLAEDKSHKWTTPAPMPQVESYNEQQLQALRNGDLAACFGPTFANLPIKKPVTIPDGRMRLVHRIKELVPNGGRFGLGLITGEADIHPDDWFLTCHFCDDMVMPGTLMYECCLHTLRVYLLRMGWIGDAADIHYQPIAGISSILKCRGQILQSTQMVTYELCIQEIGYRGDDNTPYVIADALMYADGKRVVHMKNMSMQLCGINKNDIETLWNGSAATDEDPDLIPQEALFNDTQITAYAEGKPSEAFGKAYTIFDDYENGGRKIARLPRDPFKFIDRITHIRDCQAFKMEAGGTIVARYDVPPDAWYFTSDQQNTHKQFMPFAVLLETALQPCGWMAAYVGSALSAEHDLKFRNLGGKATQYIDITPDIGTLSTKIHLSNVSSSGGMVIQNYDMEMWCDQGLVYKGDTVFGFFSAEALATQIGIRNAKLHQPTAEEKQRAQSFDYPQHAPFPDHKMRMIENITHCDLQGGSKNLGFIEGTIKVNPDAWFFQAHFFQDPVIPGSLGLESFQQLLKVIAWKLWGADQEKDDSTYIFTSMPLNHQHTWLYRGQVIPADSQVTVTANIQSIDQQQHRITAKGYLNIDGRDIYQMIQFAVEMREL